MQPTSERTLTSTDTKVATVNRRGTQDMRCEPTAQLPASRPIASSPLVRQLGIDLTPSSVAHVDGEALSRLSHHVLQSPGLAYRRPFTWDDPAYWIVDAAPRERSQYFAVGTALNFRFWRVSSGRVVPAGGTLEGQQFSGAMYMWRCLRLATERGRLPVLDADFLAGITIADFNAIFADDSGRNPLAIAGHERLANLRDLGSSLTATWSGYFWNVVQASAGALTSFCRRSQQFRAFDDPLFKLTMLNVILHTGSGLTSFDADPLPAIDYHLVKQLLRQGVLIPNRTVRNKLFERRRLTSLEAAELRRVALMAFLELSYLTGVPGQILDNLWWGNRRVCLDDSPACTNPATASNCPFLDGCRQLTGFGMPLERTRYY